MSILVMRTGTYACAEDSGLSACVSSPSTECLISSPLAKKCIKRSAVSGSSARGGCCCLPRSWSAQERWDEGSTRQTSLRDSCGHLETAGTGGTSSPSSSRGGFRVGSRGCSQPELSASRWWSRLCECPWARGQRPQPGGMASVPSGIVPAPAELTRGRFGAPLLPGAALARQQPSGHPPG